MSRETALLQLMLTPGIGARSIARVLLRLGAEQCPVDELSADSGHDLLCLCGLPPLTVSAFTGVRDEAEGLAETLAEHGIRILAITDQEYPLMLTGRLARLAPPLLFLRGEPELLARPMIGFAGARNCSEEGLAVAREMAGTLAGGGANVVSGYAPGIDTAAHFGAVHSGGATTAVLASGILHFTPRSELASFCDERNTVILSEFFPTMPWRSHSAMQRNKTICGLVQGMVIVESGKAGGTFAAGLAALEIGCPLYVVDWAVSRPSAAGNAELIRRGGTPVSLDEDWPVGLQPRPQAGLARSAQPDLFCE